MGLLLCFWGLLHWSFGLLGTEQVETEVRHRSLGPAAVWDCDRGVDGLEKNPNLELILGLGLVVMSQCCCSCCCCCLSVNNLVSLLSLGIDEQNALLQPVTILSNTQNPNLFV